MKKFPMNKVVVDVEALGGEITLYEFTQVYRVQCNNDSEFDNPTNGLLNAGLTQEQTDKLSERTARALYEEVVELTYPNATAELKKLMESGEYTEPTDDEVEESKKNS